MISWDKVRPLLEYTGRTSTFEIVTRMAFQEYVDGNSCFEDMNSLEIGAHYEVFKAGWAIRETLGS